MELDEYLERYRESVSGPDQLSEDRVANLVRLAWRIASDNRTSSEGARHSRSDPIACGVALVASDDSQEASRELVSSCGGWVVRTMANLNGKDAIVAIEALSLSAREWNGHQITIWCDRTPVCTVTLEGGHAEVEGVDIAICYGLQEFGFHVRPTEKRA